MNREVHVQFCESAGVKLPCATRLVLTIKGKHHYLWRAVGQEGNVLDILVQRRRDKKAAKKFFRKLLEGLVYVPRVIVTDKLKSYSAAKLPIRNGIGHIPSHRPQNNFPLKLAPLEVHYTASPPSHAQWSSIAEHPSSENLRQIRAQCGQDFARPF